MERRVLGDWHLYATLFLLCALGYLSREVSRGPPIYMQILKPFLALEKSFTRENHDNNYHFIIGICTCLLKPFVTQSLVIFSDDFCYTKYDCKGILI